MRQILFYGLIAIVWVMSAQAFSQNVLAAPDYYRVIGVSDDDVLNIRSEGSSTAPIVGVLAHDALPVEVQFVSSGWGYVSTGESNGFVSMQFLEEINLSLIPATDLPQGLYCGGTEPFWGMQFTGDSMRFNAMDAETVYYPITDSGAFHNLGNSIHFILSDETTRGVTAVISNQLCSDGMSDRDYPRAINLILPGPQGMNGLAGCCHLGIN